MTRKKAKNVTGNGVMLRSFRVSVNGLSVSYYVSGVYPNIEKDFNKQCSPQVLESNYLKF